jgi:hypothetical protein
MEITGTVIMQRGLLILGSNNLTAGNYATPTTNSYIKVNGSGRVKVLALAKAMSVTLPIGNSTYDPIRITLPNTGMSGTRDFTVGLAEEVVDQYNSPFSSGAVNRTWNVEINTTTPNVVFDLTWNTSSENGTFSYPDAGVFARTTGSWARLSSSSPIVHTGTVHRKGGKIVSMTSGTTYLLGVFDGVNQNQPLNSVVTENKGVNETNTTGTVLNAELNVYPNPAVNDVTISLNGVEAGQMARISIMDLAGKVIMTSNQVVEGNNFNTNLNIGQLSKGNYIINVTTATSSMTSKLIKL